jgi:ankyrin repeat protein
MSHQNKYLKYKKKYLELKNQIGGSLINNTRSGGGANDTKCGFCQYEIDCTNQINIILECGCCIHVECLCDYLDSILRNTGLVTHLECPNKVISQHTGTSHEHLMKEKEKITNKICKEKMDRLIQRLKGNDIEHGDSSIDELVSLTTKPCPKCKNPLDHPHGHDCHHIRGCPQCKVHSCYVCGSVDVGHICYYNSRYIGNNWSSWCEKKITEEDIDYSTGIPKDNRCGCVFCSDCRPGMPCKQCPGTCLVCTEIVKPGPKEKLPESKRHGWCIPQSFELIDASKEGNLSKVKSLIQAGTNINKQDNTGVTALMWACMKGYEPIVTALIRAGASVNHQHYSGMTPIMWAYGNLPIINALIHSGADLNIQNNLDGGSTILIIASRNGNLPIVNALIQAGADINKTDREGVTPLMHALIKGHETIIDSLIHYGASIDIQDENGRTALMIASKKGDKHNVDMLILRRVDVNKQDEYGRTALIVASMEGRETIVNSLIQASADVNKQDEYGRTALMNASLKGHETIVNTLIQARADVNKQDSYGYTSLIYASMDGHERVVRTLIQAGADVNKQDNGGKTALMRVSQKLYTNKSQYNRIIFILVNAGADTTKQDNEGNTANSYALKR